MKQGKRVRKFATDSKYFCRLSLAILVFCLVHGPALKAKPRLFEGASLTTASPRTVQKIDHRVRAIDQRRPHYRRVVKNLVGTDRGGALTVLYEDQQPVKVFVHIGLSNKNIAKTVYLYRSQPILVSEVEHYFEWDRKKDEIDFTRPLPSTATLVYLSENHIVCRSRNGRVVDLRSAHRTSSTLAMDTVREVKRWLGMATSPDRDVSFN